MKKISIFLLITTILSICILCCACGEQPTEETQAPTIHTMPPTTSLTIEPEWCEIDCNLSLIDTDSNEVISENDFDTFALCGSDDTNSYITIKLSEQGTQIINSLSAPTELSLIIENTVLTKVTLDPATFNGEFDFGDDKSFETLCEYANTIRGLF